MKNKQTNTKILTSAEILFSQHGFKETTLRKITKLSQTNLASVNYHFGSKKSLIIYIIDKSLTELSSIIKNNYTLIKNNNNTLSVSQVVELITLSLIELNNNNKHSCNIIYRFFDFYITNKDHDLAKIKEKFLHENLYLIKEVSLNISSFDDNEILFRVKLLLPSLLFAINKYSSVSILESDTQSKDEFQKNLYKLIPFFSVAISSDMNT